MTPTGDVIALIAAIDELEPDAVRVLRRIAARLLVGQTTHGMLDLFADGRDWREELRQELEDALVYLAMEDVKRVLVKCGQCDAKTEQPIQDDWGLSGIDAWVCKACRDKSREATTLDELPDDS